MYLFPVTSYLRPVGTEIILLNVDIGYVARQHHRSFTLTQYVSSGVAQYFCNRVCIVDLHYRAETSAVGGLVDEQTENGKNAVFWI